MHQTSHRPRLSVRIAALLPALFISMGTAVSADLPTYILVIKNGRFQPEKLEVPANTKFRLQIRNEGPGPEEFESDELHKEKVIAEGVTSQLIFHPLKTGNYKFIGEFHPETAKGQIIAH